MANTQQRLDFLRVDSAAFEACPAESIDCVVMAFLTKTGQVVLARLNAGWNNVGKWSALWDISKKDEYGNAVNGDCILKNAISSFIHIEKRLVTTLSVDNLVIVGTQMRC